MAECPNGSLWTTDAVASIGSPGPALSDPTDKSQSVQVSRSFTRDTWHRGYGSGSRPLYRCG